ncbi:MAG: hypothetical protein Q7R39_07770 [Dehalococcoidia bacterium]|nr:hypothetical protein [Dehalococcoidia bacterium]
MSNAGESETLTKDIEEIRHKEMGMEKPVIFRELVPEIPSTTYGTFGMYKYPAKFIPQVIAYALRTYSKPGWSVFDPFAGYGTVGTVARLYENDYELWDLNPLLKYFHSVSIMRPVDLDSVGLVRGMKTHKNHFEPDWPNLAYWYPEDFLPMLHRAWGFYHSLEDGESKKILLIPLIKATRYFSYNDEKRQKLSRSPVAKRRTDWLESHDWQDIFFGKILTGVNQVLTSLEEYETLAPSDVRATVRAGINGLGSELSGIHDILITSPPYLQAQEYIRASKMDLFWLGHSEVEIKKLTKMEFPNQQVPVIPIHSPTYYSCLADIKETHMAHLYQRYFCGVLGTLSHVQRNVSRYLLLFVGSATVRTKPIPIDRIFMEHFEALGWKHEVTLVDTIVARTMFFYDKNPATQSQDRRMSTERLVVLSRT